MKSVVRSIKGREGGGQQARGDTGGATLCHGPPGPPRLHPSLPQLPAPLHPASRDWPEVWPPGHRPGAQAATNPCCLLSIARGRAGFWPQGLPGLGRAGFPSSSCSYPLSCLPRNMSWHLPAPTFGILRWAPNCSSFSIPAPVPMIGLSLDPESSSSQDSQLPARPL